MKKTEPFVMMVPDMYGGSHESVLNKIENSKSLNVQSMPADIANNLAGVTQAYWWLQVKKNSY